MLAEVEKGNIGSIIGKDMSRLGKNYVQMGVLREQLRRANVRLITVNEGVDTGSEFDDDFLPFRDAINEYCAKDISKKIKSTFKAKGESGKHIASSPPYGYLKDSADKNKWVIDEVAAPHCQTDIPNDIGRLRSVSNCNTAIRRAYPRTRLSSSAVGCGIVAEQGNKIPL